MLDTQAPLAERYEHEAMRAQEIELVLDEAAFRPDGKQVAIGGFDGSVRLHDAETGQLIKTFLPVPITEETAAR